MLDLHQLKHFNSQLNKNNVNNHTSDNIARSYQRRHSGDREAMVDRTDSEGDRCCITCIIKKIIPNLGSIKAKLWPKYLTDL